MRRRHKRQSLRKIGLLKNRDVVREIGVIRHRGTSGTQRYSRARLSLLARSDMARPAMARAQFTASSAITIMNRAIDIRGRFIRSLSVAFQRLMVHEFPPSLRSDPADVPHERRSVIARRSKHLAVRRQRDRVHRARVSCEPPA